jgi:thioredoxin reductase
MGERISRVHLVAIIGAGAAGLVFAKILVDNGLHVTVYEQKSEVGGVWNYEPGSSAMYASLRTNLPKEIMAISEEDSFPESDHSFLTHYEVQAYLKQYTDRHFLRQYIHFATEVTYVRKHGGDTGQARWRVETRRDDDVPSTACFDAVVVCNGHFHIPHTPPLPPGYREYFKGISYHSNQYDTVKSLLRGKNVLVVGSKSSGTDTARELLTIAHRVYVSDRNYASGLSDQSTVADAHVSSVFVHTGRSGERSVDAVPSTTLPTVLPAIDHVTSDGHFMFADQRVVTDIDVVLWCTGYLYDFPFLSSTSASLGAELTDGRCSEDPPETRDTSLRTTGLPAQELHPQATTTEFTAPVTVEDGKRVRPLYQQLFCINDPTLVFAGLPFRVVPFPLFRFQGKSVRTVLR